ncbi:MAG: FHA domain-containing protein [Clostridiales bacterium]|nr:FHA domain-containing protein [Clostridiales bacterium]
MDTKKRVLMIECIVVSLLPWITLLLPYLIIKITAKIVVEIASTTQSLTGIQLLKLAFGGDLSKLGLSDVALSQIQGNRQMTLFVVFILIVPLILMILTALLHLWAYLQGRLYRLIGIAPGLAAFSAIVSRIALQSSVTNIVTNLINADSSASAIAVASLGDVSLGDLLEQAVSDTLKVQAGPGYYLMVIIPLVIFLQDMLLPLMWKNPKKVEKWDKDIDIPNGIYSEEPDVIPGGGSSGGGVRVVTTWNDPNVFENPVYTQDKPGSSGVSGSAPSGSGIGGMGSGAGSGNMVAYQDDPTIKSTGKTGTLVGMRGEYAGAQLQIRSGESVLMGRSKSQCNLIFSNPKVSRTHCTVTYNSVEDYYLVTNHSSNGTFLANGQLLTPEKPYHLPHGTIFRVDKEDEFKLL